MCLLCGSCLDHPLPCLLFKKLFDELCVLHFVVQVSSSSFPLFLCLVKHENALPAAWLWLIALHVCLTKYTIILSIIQTKLDQNEKIPQTHKRLWHNRGESQASHLAQLLTTGPQCFWETFDKVSTSFHFLWSLLGTRPLCWSTTTKSLYPVSWKLHWHFTNLPNAFCWKQFLPGLLSHNVQLSLNLTKPGCFIMQSEVQMLNPVCGWVKAEEWL